MPHIVDALIEERAESLMASPLVWRLVKALIYPLLGYQRAISMADTIRDKSAIEVFRYLSDTLNMDVLCSGLEHIPRQGGAIVMPNHPAGIADGIACSRRCARCARTSLFSPTGTPSVSRRGWRR